MKEAINNQLEDNYIPLLQGKSLDNSSNHGSSSLHTSVKTSDRQIKKRRSKPKSIRVSNLSTNSDTEVEEALNE